MAPPEAVTIVMDRQDLDVVCALCVLAGWLLGLVTVVVYLLYRAVTRGNRPPG